MEELFAFLCHLAVVYVFAWQLRLASVMDGNDFRTLILDASSSRGGIFLAAWAWLAAHTAWVACTEAQQLRHVGLVDYLTDEWNLLEFVGMCVQAQVVVAVGYMVLATPDDLERIEARLQESILIGLGTTDHAGHDHVCPAGVHANPSGLCPGRDYDDVESPFTFGGENLSRAMQAVLNVASLTVLLSSLRIFYYMRGIAQLGALVQMIASILRDMGPFVVVASTIIVAFAFALTIAPSGMRRMDATLWVSMKMGLYGEFEGNELFHAGSYVGVITMGFVITVQIVLLNLLIAIMGDSYRRVQKRTLQAALFERARVVAKLERTPGLLHRLSRRLRAPSRDALWWIRDPTWLHVLDNDVQTSSFRTVMPQGDYFNDQQEGAGTRADRLANRHDDGLTSRATVTSAAQRAGIARVIRLLQALLDDANAS